MNRCPNCDALQQVIAAKDELIKALQAQIDALRQPLSKPCPFPNGQSVPPRWPFRGVGPVADPTAGCPCRPENGGSGICNCIRGSQIVCQVSS